MCALCAPAPYVCAQCDVCYVCHGGSAPEVYPAPLGPCLFYVCWGIILVRPPGKIESLSDGVCTAPKIQSHFSPAGGIAMAIGTRIVPAPRQADTPATAGLSGFHKFCTGLSRYQKCGPFTQKTRQSEAPNSNQSIDYASLARLGKVTPLRFCALGSGVGFCGNTVLVMGSYFRGGTNPILRRNRG